LSMKIINSLLANALATASRCSTAARAKSRVFRERILVCVLLCQLSGDDATDASLRLSPRSPVGPRSPYFVCEVLMTKFGGTSHRHSDVRLPSCQSSNHLVTCGSRVLGMRRPVVQTVVASNGWSSMLATGLAITKATLIKFN
jgi:hypothetical protein